MAMFSPFYTYILYMVAVCDRVSRSSIKFTLFVTEAIKSYTMADFEAANSKCRTNYFMRSKIKIKLR